MFLARLAMTETIIKYHMHSPKVLQHVDFCIPNSKNFPGYILESP
jgi:hypothetical protein